MKKRASEERIEELLVEFTENLTEKADGSDKSVSVPEEAEGDRSLFETVQMLSSVIQPKQPSEDFSARLSETLQERMAAGRIRRVIDKAITDEGFRKSFFHDMVAACRSIGLSLTPQEMAALGELKEDSVEDFANSLDERISKVFPASLP